MNKESVFRGVFYFPTYAAAKAAMPSPDCRVIWFWRGWAIQREKSGPYLGPHGWGVYS